LRVEDSAPFSAPIESANTATITQTNTKFIPSPNNCAATTFAKPMMKGVDRSMPPRRITSVWPIEATPSSEARTSIERMVNSLL
jgi:hypothetical protein